MACFKNLGCMFSNFFYSSFLGQKYTQPPLAQLEKKHISFGTRWWLGSTAFKKPEQDLKY